MLDFFITRVLLNEGNKLDDNHKESFLFSFPFMPREAQAKAEWLFLYGYFCFKGCLAAWKRERDKYTTKKMLRTMRKKNIMRSTMKQPRIMSRESSLLIQRQAKRVLSRGSNLLIQKPHNLKLEGLFEGSDHQ